jgi:Domain of unknown function (DUF4386)
MNPSRPTARIAGLLFGATIVFSIPGALLYTPLLTDPRYVLGDGTDGLIAAGALLEILTAAANIGTAVVLFPLLRRSGEALALGYVASRIVESTLIAVGIVSLLAIVQLRQGAAGDAGALTAAAAALVAVHAATFLLGPGLLAGFGNGLLLGTLLLRSGLVPRPMALVGVIGGPLQALSGVAVLFGLYAQTSPPSGLATLPEFVWEAFLAVYLTARGFRRPAVTARATVTGAAA